MIKYRSRKPTREDARTVYATKENADLAFVGAEVYQLVTGQAWEAARDDGHESALVLLTGTVVIESAQLGTATLRGRSSVFADIAPYVVYVQPGEGIRVTAGSDVELLWAHAKVDGALTPSHLYPPEEMEVESRGEGVTARVVRHLLEDPGQAERLRLVEVMTPGGHWSSFPPHKHDREDPPIESLLEELYYFHIDPPTLWAFQRVYGDDGSGEALAVYDGELVAVAHGYHPVAVPPGATAYYLNVMAGPTREWNFTVDPHFAHVPGFVRKESGVSPR